MRFIPRSTARASQCNPRTRLRSALGYPQSPIDDLLVFHTVFGKTVPDVSLNAVANLGYAGVLFRRPVYPGNTLSAALGSDRPAREFEQQVRRGLCPTTVGANNGRAVLTMSAG